MFKRILIANRGEIACRVIKTARRMGIETVAVYSEADRDALHVEMADRAVLIGPPAAAESYLVMEKIVEACRKTGAQAVHPGYGFLSEREAFPRALQEAGVVFIGPNAGAIAAMNGATLECLEILETLRAGLDAQNNVAAWLHHIAAPTTDGVYVGGDLPDSGGTELAGVGLPNGTVPNYMVEQSFLHTVVPRGYWRSVDVSWNHFAVQCFMDEVAAAAGKDPLELRRELIATRQAAVGEGGDEKPVNLARLRGVLDLVAEKSGWGKALPAGRGRGLAALYCWGTYIAYVAEVTVAKDGSVRVDRVVCAVDCGQVINPDMVAAQMEGGIVFGLTAALYGEITFAGGATQQSNFNNYSMLRIREMPRVEVNIVPSHETPGGCGEPPVPSIAPAVANAIFAATGKRLRRLPFQTQELARA